MTLLIIAITVLVSFAAFRNEQVWSKLILNPYAVKHFKQWYRLVSSGLLHADMMHLFINMFVLYSFGTAVEHYYEAIFGTAAPYLFVLLYVSSVFAANVSTFFRYHDAPHYHSLGASGAVSAILFTSILFKPYSMVLVMFIPMPAILMGVGYLWYSYYMSKRDTNDNINHEAHFYGAVYGMLFTIVFKPALLLFFFRQLLSFNH